MRRPLPASPGGSGGILLHCRTWLPGGRPRAVVSVLHGIGEHSGRYARLACALNAAGYAASAVDLRGHGLSPGPRGHVVRWSDYLEDASTALERARGTAPGAPVFLYGHSMGALVALDLLCADPGGIAGAVISGAPIEPAGVGSPLKAAVARVLSGLVPGARIGLGLDAAALSRDASVVAAYREDPLVHGTVSARWGAETLAAVARVRGSLAAIRTPVLVVHGGADRLNLPSGALRLFSGLGSEDRTLLMLPGCFHEPHNDICHEELESRVIAWLDRMTASGDPRGAH